MLTSSGTALYDPESSQGHSPAWFPSSSITGEISHEHAVHKLSQQSQGFESSYKWHPPVRSILLIARANSVRFFAFSSKRKWAHSTQWQVRNQRGRTAKVCLTRASCHTSPLVPFIFFAGSGGFHRCSS